MKVGFFIIGASKCGTTALSQYLSEHRNICFSIIKEPHFFSEGRYDKTVDRYHKRNFSHYDPKKHWIVGEGSGTYYSEKWVIESILKYNRDAKFIYMVRDPAEMIRSWHEHVQFFTGDNDDLETAWEQSPKYRKLAALGTHLEVLRQMVPPKQLMVIHFDDFIADTKKVYQDVLYFLGVPYDGRVLFPRINEAKAQRSKLIGRLNQMMPGRLSKYAPQIKRALGIPMNVPLNPLTAFNAKSVKRQPIPESVIVDLRDEASIIGMWQAHKAIEKMVAEAQKLRLP